MDSMNSILIDFPVYRLDAQKRAPVVMNRITLTKRPDEAALLRFELKRDLSVQLKSFTIRYRFSGVPVCAPDPSCKFYSYTYDVDDINQSTILEVPALIPRDITVESCGAYISDVTLMGGERIAYDSAEYRFMLKSRRSDAPSGTASPAAGKPTAPNTTAAKTNAVRTTDGAKPKKKHAKLAIILGVLLVSLVAEAILGVYFYRYLGVKNSADYLIDDNRYNEAYKLALDANQKGILQRVCEKAAVYYFSVNDLESAYIYAYGAPEPFTDMIIDYAAQSVINISTGKINETSFRVAKMSDNDEKFDSIIHSVCEILMNAADYSNAIRVSSELRGDDDRSKTEYEIFEKAVEFYVDNNKYREAVAFINELENVPTFNYTKAQVISGAVGVCKKLGDNACILYLAQCYPESAESIAAEAGISADDPGVRSELQTIYPLLTENQKRAYHAQQIAVWNRDVLQIDNGNIKGTDITNAMSVDTNDTLTLVLHKDGSVSAKPLDGSKLPYAIPEYSNIIDIALGAQHAVLLHSDGTVTVLGDNSYSQANVSEWKDIVAVAAGEYFTLGLKIDGTVVAAGSNACEQCDVSKYNNVVDIAACNQTSVLLFADGTVMLQGYRSMGLSEIEAESSVRRIRAGAASVIVELSNGKYKIFEGQLGGSCGDPYNWNNMSAFDVGVTCIAGIDKIGVLVIDGDGIQS